MCGCGHSGPWLPLQPIIVRVLQLLHKPTARYTGTPHTVAGTNQAQTTCTPAIWSPHMWLRSHHHCVEKKSHCTTKSWQGPVLCITLETVWHTMPGWQRPEARSWSASTTQLIPPPALLMLWAPALLSLGLKVSSLCVSWPLWHHSLRGTSRWSCGKRCP